MPTTKLSLSQSWHLLTQLHCAQVYAVRQGNKSHHYQLHAKDIDCLNRTANGIVPVVHVMSDMAQYPGSADPDCLVYVWNDLKHKMDTINWKKVTDIVMKHKTTDVKRNNSRVDYGYCGTHNPTRTKDSDGLVIPKLHKGTHDPFVVDLFLKLTSLVQYLNDEHDLGIYNDSVRKLHGLSKKLPWTTLWKAWP